jgi:transportin-1
MLFDGWMIGWLVGCSERLNRPLDVLIPKFISCFLSKTEALRVYALSSCNHFLYMMPPALVQHLEKYMQALFALAGDPSKSIRRLVCQAFVILLEVRYDALKPQMANVIKYMIKATEDEDEVVALEACEFWSPYCDNSKQHPSLHLPFIFPFTLTLHYVLNCGWLLRAMLCSTDRARRPESVAR